MSLDIQSRMEGCNPSHPGKLARALFLPTHLASLPPSPKSYDAHNGFDDYRWFLNNRYGTCVVAEMGNMIRGLSFATQGKAVEISDAFIQETYFTQTGGRDNGLNLADALNYWNQHGFKDTAGKIHKPDVYGAVDVNSLEEFDKACFYFDGLDIGVYADSQMKSAAHGSVLDGTGSLRGTINHCVGLSGRREDGCYKLITWSGILWVTEGWLKSHCGEAWAIPFITDRLCPNGKTIEGFDVDELKRQFAVFQGKPFEQ